MQPRKLALGEFLTVPAVVGMGFFTEVFQPAPEIQARMCFIAADEVVFGAGVTAREA
jgi:hypothetical protein